MSGTHNFFGAVWGKIKKWCDIRFSQDFKFTCASVWTFRKTPTCHGNFFFFSFKKIFFLGEGQNFSRSKKIQKFLNFEDIKNGKIGWKFFRWRIFFWNFLFRSRKIICSISKNHFSTKKSILEKYYSIKNFDLGLCFPLKNR